MNAGIQTKDGRRAVYENIKKRVTAARFFDPFTFFKGPVPPFVSLEAKSRVAL